MKNRENLKLIQEAYDSISDSSSEKTLNLTLSDLLRIVDKWGDHLYEKTRNTRLKNQVIHSLKVFLNKKFK